MKKLLAIILAVLMVVPFGIVASAAKEEKAEIPAEPVPYRDLTLYCSYQKTSGVQASNANTGLSADQLLATWGGGVDPLIREIGGVVCIPGKGYIGQDYAFPKTPNPITITAFDPQLNKKYVGTLEVDNGDGTYSNGTQIGMFMIFQDRTLTIESDVIFENIDIIERQENASQNQAQGTSNISVANGGKLVIKEDVQILKMTPCESSVIMNIDAGGYLYLHSTGFEKYTGDGVIVVEKSFWDAGKLDRNQLLEFNGAIVTPDGQILDGEIVDPPDDPVLVPDDSGNDTPADTKKPPSSITKVPTSNKTPETTTVADAEEASDFPIVPVIIGVVAAVVVVAVVIVVISKKKKAE